MNKIMIRMAGMLCSILIGFTFTACEHDDDYESVANSPLIGTWDAAEGFDEAMNEQIPAYEYIFQTMNYDETEYKNDNPDTFEGIERPVQYDRVTFTADIDGGHAIFYKRDASGNMVEGARYIACYAENMIRLYNTTKIVEETVTDEEGNETTVTREVPDYSLFKEFAVEKLSGDNLKIVWNKSQRIEVTYTNQYESYNFKRVN